MLYQKLESPHFIFQNIVTRFVASSTTTHFSTKECVAFTVACPWHAMCFYVHSQMRRNNVVYATSKISDQPAHMRGLISTFACRMNILWILRYDRPSFGVSKLKRGCTCTSESTHVKMPHCWKSHVVAHFNNCIFASL